MNDIAAMMRYERAGDQHVGRIASGLPTEQPDFAILPPMFHTTDQERTSQRDCQTCISICVNIADACRGRSWIGISDIPRTVSSRGDAKESPLVSNHPLLAFRFCTDAEAACYDRKSWENSDRNTSTCMPSQADEGFAWRGDSSCNDHNPTRISS